MSEYESGVKKSIMNEGRREATIRRKSGEERPIAIRGLGTNQASERARELP